jgi:hypothetical protein
VKVGDLVKTLRESVGVPAGTKGIIIGSRKLKWTDRPTFDVDIFEADQYGIRKYVYFEDDLEVVSESR